MFGITERAHEVERKLTDVRALLERRGLRAVVLRDTGAVAWVTGGLTNRIEAGNPASAAWVVVTPGDAHVVTTNVELPRLAAEGDLEGFELHGVDWYEPDGFEGFVEQFAAADAGDDLIELRLALGQEEQERLAALGLDATAALEDAVRHWTPGELDVEVQARIAGGLERAGAFGACLIVGGDDRVERFRHPLAACVPVHRLLMAVVVAERHGLHVAATRFACAGPLPESVREAHRAAAVVERAVLDASQPPATYGSALAALAGAYAGVGRPGEWRDHYQGGPIGYRQREFEIVPSDVESRWFSTPISVGTALAWNPSIAGGGKCEDTYLVEESGLQRLTDSGEWPLEDGRPAILDIATGEAA
jgi:Xaa-Pro dipeptidase